MNKQTIETLHKKGLFESPSILKALIPAHRHLAELKGLVRIMPNEGILLSNLTLQEAQDSSAIENIVTSQDSIYKHQIEINDSSLKNKGNKEVYGYAQALNQACDKVKSAGGISLNIILEIQAVIEPKRPGWRKVPGTVLKNISTKEVVYTPPSPEKIPDLMNQWEGFMNNTADIDPLVKMALIHHWFESIHPFYDGNGRTGRIINILYLILSQLLDSPVLYLSRYIHHNRSEYYRLLQATREQEEAWSAWIVYMLKGLAETAEQTTQVIQKIDKLFKQYKKDLRGNYKFYSHDLINNIFSHPYTKVKFLAENMQVSRATASRYLDELFRGGLLEKDKMGKESYYINRGLFNILKSA